MQDVGDEEVMESSEDTNLSTAREGDPELLRREMELCRREKELIVRELQTIRRENEALRRMRDADGSEAANDATRRSPALSQESNATNINAISGLLGHFEGDDNMFEAWEKRVKSLRGVFGLTNDLARFLISSCLKSRTQEWFHSRPDYSKITVDKLLGELRNMFFHEPSKVQFRKQFKQRV